jgi:IS30 family transposase
MDALASVEGRTAIGRRLKRLEPVLIKSITFDQGKKAADINNFLKTPGCPSIFVILMRHGRRGRVGTPTI